MHSSGQEVCGDFSLLLAGYGLDKTSQQRKLGVRICGLANGAPRGMLNNYVSKILYQFDPIRQSIKILAISERTAMEKLSEIDIPGWSLLVLVTSV
jgi:hypothetical protein